MISETTYNDISRRLVEWLDGGCDDSKVSISDQEMADHSFYEFVNNPPNKFYANVSENQMYVLDYSDNVLGSLTLDHASMYKSNFGDIRFKCRVRAYNGKNYHGIFFLRKGYVILWRD